MNNIFYPAIDWLQEEIEPDFEMLINPKLDDISRKLKVSDLQAYLSSQFSDSLPYISSVVTDGVTITGTGSVDDPLTVTPLGAGDSNIANTNLALDDNRTLDLSGYALLFYRDTLSNSNQLHLNPSYTTISYDSSYITLLNDIISSYSEEFEWIESVNDNQLKFNFKGLQLFSGLNVTPLRFYNLTNTFYTGFKAGNNLADVTFTLPISDGTTGQVLVTDGSGNLSFATPAGGGVNDATYLTLTNNGTLTNERALTLGDNLLGVDGGANSSYTLSVDIGALELNVITDSPSTNVFDYNPTGWNSTYPNKATVIRCNPTKTITLSGIAGGSAGRICVLHNPSNHLIIIEHESPSSIAANRICMPYRNALFLMPKQTVTFVYDAVDQLWEPIEVSAMDDQFTIFDDMHGGPVNNTSNAVAGLFSINSAGTGVGGQDSSVSAGSQLTSGNITLTTGSTASGVAVLGSANQTAIFNTVSTNLLYISRILIPTLSDGTNRFRVLSGFHNNMFSYLSGGGTSNGMYWKYDEASSPNWVNVVEQAGVQTTFNTGVAISTSTIITLGVYVTTQSSVTFFYSTDGITYNITTAATTNIPTGGNGFGAGNGIYKALGTTARTLATDYIGITHQFTRG